jgi:ParB/RepB/Spo0J family partition protein
MMTTKVNTKNENIFKYININEILISKTNPRSEFEENSLNELAESIKEHGIIQPITVRKPKDSKKFEIVCGERRFRASKIAGLKSIPVSIKELTDEQAFELQIIENLERKDVHPMDEAIAFKKMIDNGNYTIEDISAKVAKNQTFVVQRLKLNDLIEELKNEFWKGEFGIGHAILFARLTEDKQIDIYKKATTGWKQGYGTLKDAKEDLENENEDLDNAIFAINDDKLIPSVGACFSCLKCSSSNSVLFPEFEGNLCFDSMCFEMKETKYKFNLLEKVISENPQVLIVREYRSKDDSMDDFIKDIGKIALNRYDDYNDYGNEGEEVQAWHADKAEFVNIFLTKKSNEVISNNSNRADSVLLNEITKINDRANRALELDREKIYKRSIDELVNNEDHQNILLSGNDLKHNEKVALCSLLLGYNDEWFVEEFKIDKNDFRNDKLKFISQHISDELIFKIIRKYLQKELVSMSRLDYVKNHDANAYFNILKDYFPNEINEFTNNQNSIAKTRIEKTNARINEINLEIQKLNEEKEQYQENLTDLKTCAVCQKSDTDFIDEHGIPAIWKDDVCLSCSLNDTTTE